MSKSSKKRDRKEKEAPPGKKIPVPAIAVILVIAIAAIAGYILLNPGTGSAGTGSTSPGVLTPQPTSSAGTSAVKSGDTVSVYYTGKYGNGTVFDSNIGKPLLSFTVGSGQVIPGFEKAVIGMEPGQEKTVTIPADQAYGPYRPELIQTVNRTGNLATMDFREGESYAFSGVNGAIFTARILEVTPTTLTWDANSPLAGQDLTFTIQLVDITTNR